VDRPAQHQPGARRGQRRFGELNLDLALGGPRLGQLRLGSLNLLGARTGVRHL
jgi:hypothetical protein